MKPSKNTEKPKKASAGSVSLESFRDRLRVRFSFNGKQYTIGLGVSDTLENRKLAQAKVKELQSDLVLQRFNPENLSKYKLRKDLNVVRPPEKKELTLTELWNKYVSYKSCTVKAKTLNEYKTTVGSHINKMPVQDISKALDVRKYLLAHTTDSMTKRILIHINACVKWGIKNKLVELDKSPYEGMATELRHNWEDNSIPDAFSDQELEAIFDAFANHKGVLKAGTTDVYRGYAYNFYLPFVKFLAYTGCRPSEAIGLTWGQIDDKLQTITFDRSIVHIKGEAVENEKSKNNRSRKFRCDDKLTNLLKSIKNLKVSPNELVFKSPTGKAINYNNFSNRAWNKVVDPLLGRETTPYQLRDTFITKQISNGISAAVVAKWVDNSVRIIEERYLDSDKITNICPRN
ncbi:tyrosine-type recombinase/integrase [Gloeothece verrucosa]|uniref:Integrase family protein n=1 Tax=Gloeothece verrucosa (strain PCC 7822) TaxID=497965 RepID=E0U538_GLOV7|nr:tyrosine-type recombinase/integrase [Gloeothece verrucosa]ADN12317.1 integrase family protein [Gloeothece verrucosa PCC 7822]